MFKDISKLMGLLGNAGKIREEVERLQQRVAQLTVEGDAGGGMVKAKASGKMEIVALTLTDEALKNDREMLEDLIRGAVNQALAKARQLVAEETGKMATGLGLPPGMGLPGM